MTKQLLTIAYKSQRARSIGILVLTLLSSIVGGSAMGLLLPLIEVLQSPSAITSTHPISRFVANVLAYLHLPMNLWVLVACGLALYVFEAILGYSKVDLVAKTSASVGAEMRVGLFSSLLRTQIGYFHQEKVGDLTNVLVTEASRGAAALMHLISTLSVAGLLIAHLLIAFLISWRLSLVAFCLAAPVIYLTRRRQAIIQKGQEIRQANDALQSTTVEYLLGIREVKLFGLEQWATEDFRTAAENVSRQNWLLQRLTARFNGIYQVVAVGVLFLLIGLAFFMLKTPVPEMAAFLALLYRILPMTTGVQHNRDKFLGTLPGFEAVNELLEESKQHQKPVISGANKHDRVQSSIDFHNVSFVYDGHDVPVLRNINLCFEQEKTTAIVGASGAGKSTLVDLIARFYDPTEGQVLVDGIDLKQVDLPTWRSVIGFVSQDTFLFNDTILKNIWYGNLQASEEEVIEAARRAHVHEFILELPQGYHTVIGDRGVKLSGGQRQRLALARSILRNPQILILDEATSDLDSKSEHLIQDSLREMSRNRTVIVIAHRLSTIEGADEIVVLEEGCAVERGTHQALLQEGQHYAEYYDLQFGKDHRPASDVESLTDDIAQPIDDADVEFS